MKPHVNWSYTHYVPPFFPGGDIHICRVVPSESSIALDWVEIGAESYQIYYRKREIGEYQLAAALSGDHYTIEGLTEGCEYEFFVRAGEKKSRVRLARCGKPFDTVVNYLHPDDECYSFSGHYLCSPCILRHPEGFLLASMDVYGAEMGQNLTMIFRSDDEGVTWKYVSQLFPCFWARMFIHRGALYALGCSTEYGDLLIGKSLDGGKTFSAPTVLLRGGGGKAGASNAGIHKNPQPVRIFAGRIWNTMEWGSWKSSYFHAAMVMSAPEDADLLDANNWLFSDPVLYNPQWPGIPHSHSAGTIEGCLVEKDGALFNIMRYDMKSSEAGYGLALVYRVNTENPEAPLAYERAMAFPANHSKFVIQYHPGTGKYFSIATRIKSAEYKGSRKLLSLMASDDLEKWDVVCDLADRTESSEDAGFQYVDFIIEENTILYLCRTAINRPRNYHDSNYSTFGKIHLADYYPERKK